MFLDAVDWVMWKTKKSNATLFTFLEDLDFVDFGCNIV